MNIVKYKELQQKDYHYFWQHDGSQRSPIFTTRDEALDWVSDNLLVYDLNEQKPPYNRSK